MSKLPTSVTNLFHQFQKCFVTIFQTLTALHANHWTLHNNPCLFSTVLESKLFFVYSNLNENKTENFLSSFLCSNIKLSSLLLLSFSVIYYYIVVFVVVLHTTNRQFCCRNNQTLFFSDEMKKNTILHYYYHTKKGKTKKKTEWP